MGSEERFAFMVEWLDPNASLVRQYQLLYYSSDKTLEMHDLKNRRIFLKRCEYPSVRMDDLYLGSTITVLGRQLNITDYADEYTGRKLQTKCEKTVAVLSASNKNIGKMIHNIFENNFRVANLRMLWLSKQEAEQFAGEGGAAIGGSNVVALELVAENAIESLKSLNLDVVQSTSSENVNGDISFFFGSSRPTTASFQDCALCLVKPHSVAKGDAGQIIDDIITDGFEITAMQMFTMDRPNAEEFLDVYKGVVPEYCRMVDELTAGASIAIEVKKENPVESIRKLAGPHDPEIARLLRPDTLRSRFGSNKVQNCVHTTDLPEDGILEAEYFFKVLQ